jgi:hypothetical protein
VRGRRGAPVKSFARISDAPILLHSQIYNPDYVVVLDPELHEMVDVVEGLKRDGGDNPEHYEKAMGAPWTYGPISAIPFCKGARAGFSFTALTTKKSLTQLYRRTESTRTRSFPTSDGLLEGFILSHTYMPVKIPDQEDIDAFSPPTSSVGL